MSPTLPARILRLLASRVVLAGLRFFTVCAERLAADVKPDLAALDADERAMFSDPAVHCVIEGSRHGRTLCGIPSIGDICVRREKWTERVSGATCPDCLRAYHGEERPS